MMSTPIIPNSYIIRRPRDQIGKKRVLTVRKYSTTVPYERKSIERGLKEGQLVFGSNFGVIQTYDEDDLDRNIRALCGLVGERNLVLLNEQTNELNFLRIKHVLLATLLIEFTPHSDSGKMEFLTYGGRQGRIELWRMLRQHFELTEDPIPRQFTDQAIRNLCDRFFSRLFQITFDPFDQKGWGTISAADFKSSRGQYIDPEVDRMQQIHENTHIVIRTFESELRNQTIDPLKDFYDIRFSLLKDSGVNMQIPELNLSPGSDDIEYETVLYDFAQQSFLRIIGDEELYEDLPEKDRAKQLELF